MLFRLVYTEQVWVDIVAALLDAWPEAAVVTGLLLLIPPVRRHPPRVQLTCFVPSGLKC